MVKIIYLSIYYSNVGLNVRLDYDSIYTILFLFFFKSSFFKKKILNFFPLELYSWLFISLYIVKEKELQSSCIKLQPAFSLGNNHIFLLCDFKALLKILNLIMYWIFGLITSHLTCSIYLGEWVWLWCRFYFCGKK